MKLSDESLAELQQRRAKILEFLVDANKESSESARVAARGLHLELVDVTAAIDAREGRQTTEKATALRQHNKASGEYENGAILKPSESVRSYLQENGFIKQPEFEGLGLGALMRIKVTEARNELERRAQNEGTDSAGGFTVPDIVFANFIDKLRAQLVCVRLGAQTVPLQSDKSTIARTADDPVATWRAENAAVNVDDATFEGVILVPRSLAVLVKVSRELLEDSVNIDQMLEASLRGAMAVEVDRVCLVGSGTPPEPKGIFFTSGINSLGAAPFQDYDDLIDGMAECWEDNSPITSGIVLSPGNLALLAKLKESTTDAPLRKPDILQNVPILMTTSMDQFSAIIGDFSKLIIGIRTSLRIEILRELYAENLQYAFLAHLRMDVAVEHPESFCRLIISS